MRLRLRGGGGSAGSHPGEPISSRAPKPGHKDGGLGDGPPAAADSDVREPEGEEGDAAGGAQGPPQKGVRKEGRPGWGHSEGEDELRHRGGGAVESEGLGCGGGVCETA